MCVVLESCVKYVHGLCKCTTACWYVTDNYSLPNFFLWNKLKEELKKHPKIRQGLEPYLQFLCFGDSSLHAEMAAIPLSPHPDVWGCPREGPRCLFQL